MSTDVRAYHNELSKEDKLICDRLHNTLSMHLPNAESKVWHGHPVWFVDGNPVVGYSKQKQGIALLFWSGQSFEEPELSPEGRFKAAEIRYTSASQVNNDDLKRYLEKAVKIQWDYKNIVKNKGRLELL